MAPPDPQHQHVNETFRLAILIWMSFQNALHTIFMRYSRSRRVARMYLPSVAVFWMEMIKLIICLLVVVWEERGINGAMMSVRRSVIDHPYDTLRVCIPSFVYTISNNLFYVAATYLDAATFAISSQLKLLTTAVFSVLILRKPVARLQWLALLVLFAGVSVVQWSTLSSPSKSPSSNHINQSHQSQSSNNVASGSAFFGIVTAFLASLLAGFAGVYFEKILKTRSAANQSIADVSVWMRNVQLAVSSVPIALMTAYLEDGEIVREYGLTYGFDWIVWLTVGWCSIGGLSVAVCIKYTDNIRKNFATSVAIVLSTLISIYVFNFRPNIFFAIGAGMVVGAIFMYTKYAVVSGSTVTTVGAAAGVVGWTARSGSGLEGLDEKEKAPMIRLA